MTENAVLEALFEPASRVIPPSQPFSDPSQQTLYEEYVQFAERHIPIILGASSSDDEEQEFLRQAAELAEEAIRLDIPFCLRWEVAFRALNYLSQPLAPESVKVSKGWDDLLSLFAISATKALGQEPSSLALNTRALLLVYAHPASKPGITQWLTEIESCLSEFSEHLASFLEAYKDNKELRNSLRWHIRYLSEREGFAVPPLRILQAEEVLSDVCLDTQYFAQFLYRRWMLTGESKSIWPQQEHLAEWGMLHLLRFQGLGLLAYDSDYRVYSPEVIERLVSLIKGAKSQRQVEAVVEAVLDVMEVWVQDLENLRVSTGTLAERLGLTSEEALNNSLSELAKTLGGGSSEKKDRNRYIPRLIPISLGMNIETLALCDVLDVSKGGSQVSNLAENEELNFPDEPVVFERLAGLAIHLGEELSKHPRFQRMLTSLDTNLLTIEFQPGHPQDPFWGEALQSIAAWIFLDRLLQTFPELAPAPEPFVAEMLCRIPVGCRYLDTKIHSNMIYDLPDSLESWDERLRKLRLVVVGSVMEKCNQALLAEELIKQLKEIGLAGAPVEVHASRCHTYLNFAPGDLVRELTKTPLYNQYRHIVEHPISWILQETLDQKVTNLLESGEWAETWSDNELEQVIEKFLKFGQGVSELTDDQFEVLDQVRQLCSWKAVDSIFSRLSPPTAVRWLYQIRPRFDAPIDSWTVQHTRYCQERLDELEASYNPESKDNESINEIRFYFRCLENTPKKQGLQVWASRSAVRSCYLLPLDTLTSKWKTKKQAKKDGFLTIFDDKFETFDAYQGFYTIGRFGRANSDLLDILFALARKHSWAQRLLFQAFDEDSIFFDKLAISILKSFWTKEAEWENLVAAIRKHTVYGPRLRQFEMALVHDLLRGNVATLGWQKLLEVVEVHSKDVILYNVLLYEFRNREPVEFSYQHWGEHHLKILLNLFTEQWNPETPVTSLSVTFDQWKNLLEPNTELWEKWLEQSVVGKLWFSTPHQLAEQIQTQEDYEQLIQNDIAQQWWQYLREASSNNWRLEFEPDTRRLARTLSPLEVAVALAQKFEWGQDLLLALLAEPLPVTGFVQNSLWPLEHDWQQQSFVLLVQSNGALSDGCIEALYIRGLMEPGILSPDLEQAVRDHFTPVQLVLLKLRELQWATEDEQSTLLRLITEDQPDPHLLHSFLPHSKDTSGSSGRPRVEFFRELMVDSLEEEETLRQVGRQQPKAFPWLVEQAIWQSVLGYHNALTAAWPEVEEYLVTQSKTKHLNGKKSSGKKKHEPLAKMLTTTIKALLKPWEESWPEHPQGMRPLTSLQRSMLFLVLAVLSTKKGERLLETQLVHLEAPDSKLACGAILNRFWLFQSLLPRERMDRAFTLLRYIRRLRRNEQPRERERQAMELCQSELGLV